MRGFAFVLAILTVGVASSVSAAPTAPQRQEDATFLGFSPSETLAAFAVTVHGSGRPFRLIRLLDTRTDKVIDTFQDGEPSADPEWSKAKPYTAWIALQARGELAMKRLDVSKAVFRLAVDPGDRASAKAEKERITITGKVGHGLHTTPVVRLWNGTYAWLAETRINGSPGRTLKADVEVFHSETGMRIAVVTRYTSDESAAVRTTDVVRVFELTDPLATHSVGSLNIAHTADMIGERLFKQLHPEAKEMYDRYGRD